MRLVPAAPLAALVIFTGCSSMPNSSATPGAVTSRSFGTTADGRAATLWTLRASGIEADVTDYGATLVALRVPDRNGAMADVVLGFDDVAGYQSAANQYFGCTTGRVCNRIAKGKFTLDGHTYTLATNNGPNHLHGGKERSLDKVMWKGEVLAGDAPAVRFTYRSPDGEEGYPGNLDVTVTYSISGATQMQPSPVTTLHSLPGAKLGITFDAKTDARTPVNLTNHAYWNLAGAGAPTVLDHELQISAHRYTPTDDTLIPTGEIATVTGTPLDFTTRKPLGARIGALDATAAKGYDHNFVLDDSLAASLRDPGSGRTLTIITREPGLQVYSGNFLNGQRGKGGRTYPLRSAVCLETQHFPDSVNHARFPSTILEPGTAYLSTTTFVFLAK